MVWWLSYCAAEELSMKDHGLISEWEIECQTVTSCYAFRGRTEPLMSWWATAVRAWENMRKPAGKEWRKILRTCTAWFMMPAGAWRHAARGDNHIMKATSSEGSVNLPQKCVVKTPLKHGDLEWACPCELPWMLSRKQREASSMYVCR